MTQKTEQPFPPTTFTVADPRTFDGDAYEVAERALRQVAAVAGVLEQMLDPADKMARNAEMERAFANHEAPQGSEWPRTPQGKVMTNVKRDVALTKLRLRTLAQAAGFNPRNPLKE